jgi:hypothetical protein
MISLQDRDPVMDLYGLISNYEFFLKLVSSRKAVQQFVKYVDLTLGIFDETPRYFPVAFRTHGW